jgi:hypothetical protein
MSENTIYETRKRSGFTVSKYGDGGAINIKAELKKFLQYLTITNRKSVFGNSEECIFDFYEVCSFQEVMVFLKANFTPVPQHIRFTWPDGIKRNVPVTGVYLSDGNILAWRSSSGTCWFSLEVISKDRIIK